MLKMWLTDWTGFHGAHKQSISDGQIGPADGSDELAVLGKSLGCSLLLDLKYD